VIFVSVPFLREKTLSIFERKDPRYFETKAGLEVYKQSPVFGLGITDFEPPLMKEYEKLGFQEGIDNSYNDHNEYLHLAIIAGLPALLCFILILVECFRQALRRHSYFGMAFNILFFASCLTEVVLNRHKGIIFFAFFATLIYIFPKHEKDPAR
jgi:O-antigen ligase